MRQTLLLLALLALAPSATAAPLDGCRAGYVVVCVDEWEIESECEDDLSFGAGSTTASVVAAGFQVVVGGYSYCYRFGDDHGSANNVNGGVYGVLFVGAGAGTYSYTDADGTEEGTYVSVVWTYGDFYQEIPIAPVHPDPGWGHLLP